MCTQHLFRTCGSLTVLAISALVCNTLNAQDYSQSTAASFRGNPLELRGAPDGAAAENGESTPATQDSREVFYTLLNESQAVMQKVDRYSATLEKQVRLNGELHDPEIIEIKVRHEPFSVYLKWPDKHREALYVEGQYDNKVLARATKGLAALKGVWELKPTAPQAMMGCRYPITEAGLQKMVQRVQQFYFEENTSELFTCQHRLETQDNRPVVVVQVNFPTPEESPCSVCKYYFDAESKVLFGLELCEWDYQGKPAGVSEKYIFRDIDLQNGPSDIEFDADNPEYSLAMKK